MRYGEKRGGQCIWICVGDYMEKTIIEGLDIWRDFDGCYVA